MARPIASKLNFIKLVRSTGKAIDRAKPTMDDGMIEYVSSKADSKAKNWKEALEIWDEEYKKWSDAAFPAPTIGDGGGLPKEENVFCKAKNCKEATEMWEEEAKKWKQEASENWEAVADKFDVAVQQVNESFENWEDNEMTVSEEAGIEEYEARNAEEKAKYWEGEAKGWGLAVKTAQEAAKVWEEAAKGWEEKAKKWQERAAKWALRGDPPTPKNEG